MQKLSAQQENILDAIKQQTLKQRSSEVKYRSQFNEYDQRTVISLARRGLIGWKTDTIHGTGWAAK